MPKVSYRYFEGMAEKQVCKKCKRELPLDEFMNHNSVNKHCRNCLNERSQAKEREFKPIRISYRYLKN